MGIKITNNAYSELAAGLSTSATSITLTTGTGSRFPTLGAGDYFWGTIVAENNVDLMEIVKVTARSGDTLTVVRAQEGTVAGVWSTNDKFQLRITAQTMLDYSDVAHLTGVLPIAQGGTGSTNAADARAALSVLSLAGGTLTGPLSAPNFRDAAGEFNVSLGSGATAGRGAAAGYSGGAYGGIGFNLRHTATSEQYIAVTGDTVSYLRFDGGGFRFFGSAAGAAGRTVTFSAPGNAHLDASGNWYTAGQMYATGSQHLVLNTGNYSSYSAFSGLVTSSGNNGFANATWFANVRNPIWSFANSSSYGISYFQGSAGRDGTDTITLHPNGSTSATGAAFAVNGNNAFVANNVILHAGNYTSYSPTLAGSGASGTWGISITGNAATASNSSQLNGRSAHQLFNNMGQNHNTYTDFNNVPDFGAYYVQAGTNSPTGVGSHQWYGFSLGLGNDYAYSSYASQLYWPRRAQNSDTYIYVRDREGGSWTSWTKIRAGVADSASSLNFGGGYTVQMGDWGLRNTTPSGWIQLGPANASHAHIYTDRPNFYFNADLYTSGYLQLHTNNYSSYALPLSGGTLTGAIYVGTTGTGSATRALRVGPSGGSPGSFGSYAGSWRSTIEIWDNAATRMLHLTPPDGTNYNYSSIKSTDAGLRIDVGGSGGTNAIDIGTNGVANFPQGLQQGGNQVLHAGNFTSYVPYSYPGWPGSPGTDANSFHSGNWVRSSFTYSNNAPHTGTIVHFPSSGYDLQLNGTYGGQQLSFRNRNGDNGSWNTWRGVLHDGNYNSYSPTLTGGGASGTWGINITGNAATSAEAQNNYFYVRGTSPSVLLVDTDQGETRYVHHNGGSIGFLNSGGSWVLRCDNSTTYGTFSGSLSGNASTASNVAASGITGQTGMWTSAARPGPYRLYRRDDDSNYSVQTYWTGTYWRLYGYNGDSGHADTHVGYADLANNSSNLQGYQWASAGKDVRGSQIYVDNWFRNYNSGTGLYNEATANHWYSDGQYWNVGYSGTTGIRLRNGHAGTILGYLYAETSGNFGLLHNGGGWAVQVYPGGGGNLHGSWTIGGNTPLTSANYTSYSPPYSGGTLTGTWYFTGNGNTGSSSSPALQAYSTGGNGAYMSFHRGGYYAVNMGLDSDNVFRIGGWSASANRLQMDMSGNLTMAGLVRAGTNFYADQNYGYGLVGVYASTRYQGVFAMGDSYKLPADGTGPGNLYGLAWSYPSAGGVAGNLDSHGLLVLINGGLGSAISYSIVAAGNVTAYSDERLKTNWRSMPENFVERLAQVKSGIYDRIDGEQITQVGIGAQSFQRLLPEAITKAKDEIGTLSVSYGNAAMASAVELAKEIVALKREIEILKSKLH